ncbi:alkaline phosphatase [Aliiglaciecola sp. 3_MG-2023]|uniref:alkaline phosphatase n=1 Tax=Aliiglaciecola sp. 3_MG-2023 TaxID=3062644 RepID=UPI0026E17720|nr:alkaline phosphatase [Aliiglaciecola sp. 3_MG-2023]MDO6693996.1 alkaline phosphatase [Aliiglaciecola sp. 3_MG-2023]
MKWLPAVTLLLFVSAAQANQEKPKNVIMVVGDGMGPAYTTAYRYFADKKTSPEIESTVFDRHLVGMASTYPARVSGYVTDSAAGATALSAGVKSYNGAIAVDENKQSVKTVLEQARINGLKTGVAVTSQINHATPAAFSAHNESRRNYNAIADSYFDDKVNDQFALDVMLGGGWKYFIRDDRNIVDEFKAAGYQYVDDLAQLSKLKPGPVIGLFGDEGMPWALDMPGKQRLPVLVETAVKQLTNDKGYFLLVEGSQVDWAGHANDIAAAMTEMHDLALTLEWLEQYVQENPDTLVVVTADHSTGGFSIAANGDYQWDPEPLKNLTQSLTTLAKLMTSSDSPLTLAQTTLGFELTETEKSLLQSVDMNNQKALYVQLKKLLDIRSNSGWTSSGHTAVDVQIFAMGAGKERFVGHMDNTEIPKIIFELMQSQ